MQIRHVRTTDQQKKSDSRHKREQRLAHTTFQIAKQILTKRDHFHAPAAAKIGILLLQLAGDRFQFRIGLLQTDIWFEPRHNRVARCRALGQRQIVDVDLKRYPNFRDAREIETWWHHTDNVVISAVEIERLANSIPPAGETFLPKRIANERHGRPARSIFFG